VAHNDDDAGIKFRHEVFNRAVNNERENLFDFHSRTKPPTLMRGANRFNDSPGQIYAWNFKNFRS
jgi:hypothetical protein